MNTLKNLREKRAKASEELDAIQALCDKEQRGRNDEERTKWASLKKQIADLDSDIKDFEDQEEEQKRSAKPAGTPVEKKVEKPESMDLRSQIQAWKDANQESIDL